MKRNERAFSFVELLVVLAIVGVLAGLLFPAIQKTREAARRVSCANNLRQISLACLHFESIYGKYPAGSNRLEKRVVSHSEMFKTFDSNVRFSTTDRRGEDSISIGDLTFEIGDLIDGGGSLFSYDLASGIVAVNLFVRVLPLTDNQVVHDQADLIRAAMRIPMYQCPSSSYVNLSMFGNHRDYYGCGGGAKVAESNKQGDLCEDGIFALTQGYLIHEVVDGTSNTFAVGECHFPSSKGVGVSSWLASSTSSPTGSRIDGFGAMPWTQGEWTTWTSSRVLGPKSRGLTTGNSNLHCRKPINDVSFRPQHNESKQSAAFTQYRNMPFSSGHPGGTQFSFVDGHVKFVSDVIEQQTYQALSSCRGREKIAPSF